MQAEQEWQWRQDITHRKHFRRYFDLDKVGYAELSERDKDRNRLMIGDILSSHINSAVHVGKTAIFDNSEIVYHGVNLLLMRPTDAIMPHYLNYALKLLFQSGYWRGICMQAVNQASVNQQDISKVEIRYPTSRIGQQRIVARLDALSVETQRLESIYQQKLVALNELKKSLLHRAFSGEL